MNETEFGEFKKELQELMKRYDVESIDFGYSDCSDLAGVYDERIEVITKDNKVFTLEQGYCFDVDN
jgi:uncharacterized protein YutD